MIGPLFEKIKNYFNSEEINSKTYIEKNPAKHSFLSLSILRSSAITLKISCIAIMPVLMSSKGLEGRTVSLVSAVISSQG